MKTKISKKISERLGSRVIYLSYPLSNKTPLYGNGDGIDISRERNMDEGHSCNTMKYSFPNHAGTHIDAPRHFNSKGATLDKYPAEFWFFSQIEMIDLSGKIDDLHLVKPEELPTPSNRNAELILLKTGYSTKRGTECYTLSPPGVSAEVADWIRESYTRVRCLGMDIISVSSYGKREEGRLSHHAFLNPEKGEPILLIEDMDLSFKKTPKYVMVSPLIVENSDGSPCMVLGFYNDFEEL
ncbi:cyclase family protein [bacterium]|nr:cyclase family protein [bacterium]